MQGSLYFSYLFHSHSSFALMNNLKTARRSLMGTDLLRTLMTIPWISL
jgi:hypothetical protein